jgi:hypothetical protein
MRLPFQGVASTEDKTSDRTSQEPTTVAIRRSSLKDINTNSHVGAMAIRRKGVLAAVSIREVHRSTPVNSHEERATS